jgi:ribosomal protein S27AE
MNADAMNEETPTTLDTAPRFCPDCGRAAGDSAERRLCERCGSTLVIQGYCPICESRVRRRIGELCPKHDVQLLADDVEEQPRLPDGSPISWVTVKRFPDSLAVAAARIRLEAEGISTFVEGERMGAPTMYRVATGGVKLQVPTDYVAEARVILSQDWSWPDEELGLKEDDPPPPDVPPHEADSPRAFLIEFIVVLTLAIPLIAAAVAYFWVE